MIFRRTIRKSVCLLSEQVKNIYKTWLLWSASFPPTCLFTSANHASKSSSTSCIESSESLGKRVVQKGMVGRSVGRGSVGWLFYL